MVCDLCSFGGNDSGWGHDDGNDSEDASRAHDEDAGADVAAAGAENQHPNSSLGVNQSQVSSVLLKRAVLTDMLVCAQPCLSPVLSR